MATTLPAAAFEASAIKVVGGQIRTSPAIGPSARARPNARISPKEARRPFIFQLPANNIRMSDVPILTLHGRDLSPDGWKLALCAHIYARPRLERPQGCACRTLVV